MTYFLEIKKSVRGLFLKVFYSLESFKNKSLFVFYREVHYVE
jgi:hypothetical protein